MPGFFSLILSAISFFSASVSLSLSFTSTLSIGWIVFLLSASFRTSPAGILVFVPSFLVTVTLPLSSTSTPVMPGFFSLNLSAISFFSASVSLSLSFTSTLSIGLRELSSSASPLSPEPEPSLIGGITRPVEPPVEPPVPVVAFSLTTSDAGIVVCFPFLSFTVTVPSLPTVIVAPSGKVLLPLPSLLASSTAFLTAAFSSSVRLEGFATSVSFGVFTSVDIVLSLPIVFGSSPGFVTVTLPSLSTAI